LAPLGGRPQPFGHPIELIEQLSGEIDEIFDFVLGNVLSMGRVVSLETPSWACSL
jgi:hypothetical protein